MSSPLDRKAQQKKSLNKSILDFALESARGFNSRLSKLDQDKLDEYFSSLRELEQRIEREEKNWDQLPSIKTPEGIPDNYREHLKIMFDMMVLAFQSDSTRISSFLLAHDGVIVVSVILESLRGIIAFSSQK